MEELAKQYHETGSIYADHVPKIEIINKLKKCNDEEIILFLEKLKDLCYESGIEYADEYM